MNKSFRFTIIMTEFCNLNCKYCYVKDNPLEISEEVIDKIIELAKIKLNSEYNLINFNLFGGEPFVAYDKIIYLLNQINKLQLNDKIRVSIFSNATLFTKEKLLQIKNLNNNCKINFSLDGIKEAHDSARVYKDNSGSYDNVIEGIKIYREIYNPNWIVVKSMISPHNYKHMIKTAEGFLNNDLIQRISFTTVRDNVWTKEILEDYKIELKKLADFYIKNIDKGLWYDIFSIPIIDLSYKKNRYCDAGKDHYGIGPNGDIYPCQRFYNNKSPYKFGNVFDGITTTWEQIFKCYDTDCMSDCKKCNTFKNNCLGQCIAACYENGNMFKPIEGVCDLLKINLEIAQYVYENLKTNPNYLKTLDINKYGG